ncbi:MAG: hypothetical protein MI739_01995, partial [Bacteroidales bacterium]|nr:hypothetical protein [Bacteroidales bacterium]
NVDRGTTYHMRVQAVCDGDPDSKSDFSDWKSITVPMPDSAQYECPDCVCDDEVPEVNLTNFELRNDLEAGDTIIDKFGTTRFIVKTIENQVGNTYNGIFLFWVEIWNIKIICKYWDLRVNTDNVIVNMDFESVYNPRFLLDVDNVSDYIDSLSGTTSIFSTTLNPEDTFNIKDEIVSVYVNEGDSLVVVTVDDNGNTVETIVSDDADNADKTLIKDKEGNEYIVNKKGKPMGADEYVKANGGREVKEYNKEKEDKHLAENTTVSFSAAEKQKFGFDAFNREKEALKGEYPKLKNGYQPAFKSIASFGSDIVSVSAGDGNIIYRDEMGIPVVKSGENLSIRGSADGTEVALYAYQKVNDTTKKIAGKLNIMSFDQQNKKVYMVPVNNAQTPTETDLQNTLNSIYKQAVIRWEVTKTDPVDITFENGGM